MKHIFTFEKGDYGLVFDKDGNHIDLPTLMVNTKTGEIVHHELDENNNVVANCSGNAINSVTTKYPPPLTFKEMTMSEIREWKKNNGRSIRR